MHNRSLVNQLLFLATLMLAACSTNAPATETMILGRPTETSSNSLPADRVETANPTGVIESAGDAGQVSPSVVSQPATVAGQVKNQPTPPPDDGLTKDQRWLLASLQSLGPAPELHNEIWLNSPPLRLADLRGQVVLLEMWTFG